LRLEALLEALCLLVDSWCWLVVLRLEVLFEALGGTVFSCCWLLVCLKWHRVSLSLVGIFARIVDWHRAFILAVGGNWKSCGWKFCS
jgi:hypothetical protein